MKKIAFILITLLVFSGCTAENNSTKIKTTDKTETVILYFADENAQGLVPINREVTEKTPEAALNELFKGTKDSGCIEIIGEGTKLLEYENKSGDVTIDLSKEFLESSADTLVIYSIVNTITEFPDINFVSITVDGKENVQLGNYIISEKFTRNNDIILK